MRKAVIEDDVVVNVIEAPEDWERDHMGRECLDAPHGSGLEIGAKRDPETGEFKMPEPEPPSLEEQRESASLSRMDFMLALDDMGELEAVESADLPRRAKIMFQNAQRFERMHPELLSLADAMGYSDEQLDALFGIGGGE